MTPWSAGGIGRDGSIVRVVCVVASHRLETS